MNFIKNKIAEKLYGRKVIQKVRKHELAFMQNMETQYGYLHHTLPQKPMTDNQKKEQLKKVEHLANCLDNAIPGSPIPLGLDSILGFIPVIGGSAGALFSLYQIYISLCFGIPLWLVLRMLLNIVIDFVLSLIPVVGGLLNLLYKSNVYNYEGVRDWLDDPTHPVARTIPAEDPNSIKYHPGVITWIQLTKDTVRYAYSKKGALMPSKPKPS